MDIFTDAGHQHQVHDINPGNGGTPGNAAGLFWTIPMPPGALTIINNNTVTLNLSGLLIRDFFQIFAPTEALATLWLQVEWSGNNGAVALHGPSNGSVFEFSGVKSRVTISWQVTSQVSGAKSQPFEFTTTALTKTEVAELGTERNGVFA
jgi:hypothetical protein